MASPLRIDSAGSNAAKRPRRPTYLLRVRRSWMLSPECSQLLLVPPLISAEALGELHDLLTSLPIHADCDKASQNSPTKESVDETIGKITLPANEPPPQRTCNSNWRRAAQRIDHDADGTTHPRSGRRKRVPRKRASRKRRRG